MRGTYGCGSKSLWERLRGGLLGLIAVLVLSVPAAAAGDGVIQGKVANMTPGGAGVGGIEITLHTYQRETDQGQSKTTTDAEGLYRFSALNTEPEYSYGITLTYQDAYYVSDLVAFEADPTVSLDLAVYDATSSPDGVRFSQSHTVVQTQGSDIMVLEVYVVENGGLRTYVGSQLVPELNRKETIRFSLPAGAGPVTPRNGLLDGYIAIQGNELVDTLAVPPGETQIAFSYPVSGQQGILFQKRFEFPTDLFNLLVEDAGLTVEAQSMSPAPPADIQGVSYLRYDALNIAPGATISFAVSAPPAQGTGKGTGAAFKWALAGVLAVALAAGLGYSLTRRPAPARVARDSRMDILVAIARLDEDFEAGRVPEASYRRSREKLMARLVRSS